MTRPTIVIGDVHGLDYWREAISDSQGCRVVFIGDYLDPYQEISHRELLGNLRAIIALKRNRPDDIVLLLGNHDLHYFSSDAPICSRFDYELAPAASRLFIDNFDLFQYAFQDDDTIFTHAGIAHGWFVDDFRGDLSLSVADQLNHPRDCQVSALCRVGKARGGREGTVGGIFWADIDELCDPLHGYRQIAGHNRVEEVTERTGPGGGKIVFCDCLWAGNYLWLDE